MAEQVKVFSNTINQSAPASETELVVTLMSTSATEKAVIKDVTCNGAGNAVLKLNGNPIVTGTKEGNLVASGSLIVDASSTLTITFPKITGEAGATGFTGMVFSNGSDGATQLDSNGTTAIPQTVVNKTGSDNSASGATVINKSGVTQYARYWQGTLYYGTSTEWASNNPSYSSGFGSGNGMCSDGEQYFYNIASGNSNQSTIYRRDINTGNDSNLSIVSGGNVNEVSGQSSNQGAFLVYHNKKLYTKMDGTHDYFFIVDIDPTSATYMQANKVQGNNTGTNSFHCGSYSSGAAMVTTTAGVSYLMEQGDYGWWSYNIATGETYNSYYALSASTQGDETSTEYGQRGFEMAPGIFVCLGEQSDRYCRVDMNVSPPTWTSDTGSNPYLAQDSIGNSCAVAGRLQFKDLPRTYTTYVSGVSITGV